MSKLMNNENSILQIVLKFNLMMSAHKPQVTWLDEISEALKNCADGLDSYLVMFCNLPYQTQVNHEKLDYYLKLVEESLRAICYSIGVLSNRLSTLTQDESEDKKKLQKLNIL